MIDVTSITLGTMFLFSAILVRYLAGPFIKANPNNTLSIDEVNRNVNVCGDKMIDVILKERISSILQLRRKP